MRRSLAALTTASTACFLLLLAPDANAMTVGTVSGIRQGLAQTNAVEKVVRVCRRNIFTGRRHCWVDRSRPPTVCHVIQGRDGRRRLDCY